uniref:Peptidase M12B domain-containing protein n=2 Tax=Ascarididae TaxID=6250 RepID=A0A914ZHN0_PARUN
MLKSSLILVCILTLSALADSSTVTVPPQNGNDDDEAVEFDLTADLVAGRQRREPAVWGEPAPDYSGVVLDGITRYLHTLLFVDSKIARHYNFDMPLVKKEVLKMIKEANDYFYQINIRIIVVDVLQTQRSDLSLYSFEEFRNSRMSKLPRHDFAALISYRYAGGLAFVSGMCTSKAVMLCGFYPHNPPAMGSIFFHEVAHLIGVPHRNATETIDVPNCYCNEISADKKPTGPTGCLKIPGYDHDCTLQQMANLLYRNRCLRSRKSSIFDQIFVEKSLPICGNGVREHEEECDCGVERSCYNWNCRATDCTQIVKTWQMYVVLVAACLMSVTVIAFCAYWRFMRAAHPTSLPRLCPQLVCALNKKYIACLRQRSCCSRGHHYTNSMRRAGNALNSSHLINKRGKLDANSIVVLIDSRDNERLVRRSKLARPTKPPPPPPINRERHAPVNTNNETQASNITTVDTILVKKPPPLPLKSPNLSSLIANATPQLDIYEIPNSVRMRTSQLASQSSCSNIRHTQISANFDSISRKFDDFDEESDMEYNNEITNDEHMVIEYTPIQKKNDRPLRCENEEAEHCINAGDSHLSRGLGAGAMRLLGVCAKEVARVKREESFSSNDSGEQRQCVSDDTGSTGLSEEDEKSISVSNMVKQLNQRSWFV